jgi:hypothetical protein
LLICPLLFAFSTTAGNVASDLENQAAQGEEAALREQLVGQDRADWVGLWCGLKSSRPSGTARHTPTVLFASLT